MRTQTTSRRTWFAQTTTTCAGAWTASLAIGAVKERKPIRFAIVTDTHLGRQGKTTPQKQFQAIATELSKADIGFVLHLGDIIDSGRVGQYQVYKKIRDSIGKPVHEIPGNHDPVDAFAREIREAVDTMIDLGWLRVVLMNNARRTSHDGFFEASQLDWLEETATTAADENRVILVCCHVPVHTNRPPDRAWYVKPEHGQQRFYEILAAHRDRVAGVFHGHFHNGLRGWDDRAPPHEICFPSAHYNQKRGLEEKGAPGYNPDEFRAGYCLARLGEGTLSIRYKPIGEAVVLEKALDIFA